MFAVILALGLVNSVGSGIRYGLLSDIVPPDGYVLGRSMLNISVGAMQIAGFAVGGVLLAVVSPRMTLAIGAAPAFVAALVLQERLIALTGEDVRGQALGLQVNGMKAMQAIGATLAGLIAQYVPAGVAMATMAAASLAVTAGLSPGLRLSDRVQPLCRTSPADGPTPGESRRPTLDHARNR
ncbi:hypothetical protein AB0M44_47035 [Streptosporangium subroseum]|uniref:hypothetical protein n=1 Tax=Streptosporangium subroseum TaxID=106412 RepID=UPI0034358661